LKKLELEVRFYNIEFFEKKPATGGSLILNFPKDQNQFSSKKLELEVIKKDQITIELEH
jgi:hypothetical protein